MARKPNIVLIMVDDMGYSDIGCYGGDVRTPNLDALAAEGVRFTHAYNTSRCCPARASLMTGLYPHMAGMGWMTVADLGADGYAGNLNRRCLTIAEALAPGGYRSYMSGKWHLASVNAIGPDGPKHSWPIQRGFDRFFGTLAGGGSYWRPNTLSIDNEHIELPPDFYYTDAISDNACGFIADHGRDHADRPFFLYVAYTAPHWPLHAKAEDIARYRGTFHRGWDALRSEKFDRMREMQILDEHWSLSARDPQVPAWDSLSPEKQDEFDLRMAIYCAQIDSADQGIGRIVEALRGQGMLDDTLILFLSDNGGCHEEIHAKEQDPATFGTHESFESYGRPWANYSNVPFREFKSWVHEGGIATPLIAHWPKGFKGGRFDHQPCHITDIMPTCLAVAGLEYAPPPERNAWPLVGRSLTVALAGETIERECIFWEHEANRALRIGKWKLVAKGIDGPWELYDMQRDRTELHDLAAEQPDRARAMAAQWTQIAETTDVYPLDGRGWHQRIEHPLAVSRPEEPTTNEEK